MSRRLPHQEVPGAMDDRRLYLVRLLYGEALPNGRAPEADPELADEWQTLQEVKAWLDARPRHRPDPTVIDRIVAAAARPGGADRRARRLARRRWRWGVSIGTLMLLIGALWHWFGPYKPVTRTGVVVAEQASTAPEPVDAHGWLSLIAQVSSVAGAEATPRATLVLRWDDRAAVQQVYRQLQLLEARSTPARWGPALPLEAWPTGNGRPGLIPAARRYD
ncbi:hypothetical protein [Rhodothermus profundi]|uniref:Uncharacterized protein n=1 Tax=Rhodothermus profundi TaxID=633813 RepID=A0A1M6VH11_9BACT|nr:hypothetical protein [Rhodothermus profundi]SHK80758.1 hypothetical protein SAMN04488087_2032 [Rhodothermus profundi]